MRTRSIQADMRRRAAKVLRVVDIFWTQRKVAVDSDRNVDFLRDEMLKAVRRMQMLTRLRTRKQVWALAREVEFMTEGGPQREGLFEDVVKCLRWASNFAEKEDSDGER